MSHWPVKPMKFYQRAFTPKLQHHQNAKNCRQYTKTCREPPTSPKQRTQCAYDPKRARQAAWTRNRSPDTSPLMIRLLKPRSKPIDNWKVSGKVWTLTYPSWKRDSAVRPQLWSLPSPRSILIKCMGLAWLYSLNRLRKLCSHRFWVLLEIMKRT